MYKFKGFEKNEVIFDLNVVYVLILLFLVFYYVILIVG